MKFALRKVAGWKDRHINMIDVMNKLNIRMKRGFTLTTEERQYYSDTYSLIKKFKQVSKSQASW